MSILTILKNFIGMLLKNDRYLYYLGSGNSNLVFNIKKKEAKNIKEVTRDKFIINPSEIKSVGNVNFNDLCGVFVLEGKIFIVLSSSLCENLSFVSYAIKYGISNSRYTLANYKNKVRNGKLKLSCTPLCKYINYLFPDETRIILWNSKMKENGIDDSHTVLEFKHQEKFCFFDPSFNVVIKKDGVLLSCDELLVNDKVESYVLTKLGSKVFDTVSFGFMSGYVLLMKSRCDDLNFLRQYYTRVFGSFQRVTNEE